MRSVVMAAVAAAMLLAPVSLADAQPRQQQGENRCGWLQNPTPANYWFTDRDGEWTIQTQGP